MTKKYSKFLPSIAEDFSLENFPYYWVTQVHAQYIQNVDHALKKYGLDNSRRRILLSLKSKPHASVSIYPKWSFRKCRPPQKSSIV